jgi:polyisoprenoid-binding protein YceI
MRKGILLLVLFCVSTLQAQVKTDQGSVKFKIKNAGISVNGNFSAPICVISFDPKDVSKSKFSGVLVTSSINTDNQGRDAHLRKPDYFDATKYPTIKIESTSISADGNGRYKAKCTLTLKDVSKSIDIPFTYIEQNGSFTMEGSFSINRRDYGVGDKSLILSDNVSISIKVIGKK